MKGRRTGEHPVALWSKGSYQGKAEGNSMKRSLAILALLLPMSAALAQFDHSYGSWNALLKKHVVLINYGKASQVRYADFAKDRPALKAYLDSVSKVTDAEFKSWSKPQQMA